MLNQIRSMQASLSKAEKKVAAAILEQPQTYVNATLSELAKAAQVSEPTIVRFCRTLKMQGFREFRLRLAQDLVSKIQYQHSQIDANDSTANLIDKVLHSAISSLDSIRNQLDGAAIDLAIELLSESRRIEIYGVGGAGIVVSDAQLKFARLGLNSNAYCDTYLQRTAAAMLDEDCCVLAISNSGRSTDLLSSIKLAKTMGAKVISISNGRSPLSLLSDSHLTVEQEKDDDSLVPIKARIAHMVVVDILAIGLALRCKPSYLEKLHNANQGLVKKFETPA
ncbi:MAG: RpiR family carbohydrate utilization transcriptional regulator [Gammaproteobacteria bacterium]|jgi:RpiR family carbohydrate utilization transcriptional regulator